MTGVTYEELLHIVAGRMAEPHPDHHHKAIIALMRKKMDKYDKLMLVYDYMIEHGLIEDV